MPLRAALLALLLCAVVGTAAEIKTLKGEVVKGEVVSITSKEIVLDVAGVGNRTFPVNQIVGLDFPAPKAIADKKYSDVELVDGTLLHCTDFSLKGTTVTAKLLGSDVHMTAPVTAVANVLRDAQDPAIRKAWDQRLSKKRTHDAVAVNTNGVINPIDCTIESADDAGENITFKLKSDGTVYTRKLATYVGFIFQRPLDPKAPPVICKLTDAGRSLVLVAAVESQEDGLHVLTSSKVELLYKPEQVARLDYSSANLSYLSDLTPTKVEESSTDERVEHYRKDRNMDGNPLRLLGQPYVKGLALHAHTALEYRLKGEFRTFQAMVGIDDQVGGHSRPVLLKIEADGTVIYNQEFTRKDQKERVRPVTLNIKDVQVLRVIVTHAESDFLDLGLHLDLADARVVK